MASQISLEYERRKPEKTVLYQVVRDKIDEFRTMLDEAGRSLPRFVDDEFDKFLGCGVLGRGFVRCYCRNCRFNRLVAFSCRCRGFCSTCIGRRMADTAAYLVDCVIPDIPMRTWTLTLPYALRYLCAYNREVLGDVITAFNRSLHRWLRRQAKREFGLQSIDEAHPGSITWPQRFGSAANLNVHLHSLGTEGVFIEDGDKGLKWRTLPDPTSEEIAAIALETAERVAKALQKRGLALMGEDGDFDEFADAEPLLAQCYAASIRGYIATGARAGQKVMMMGVAIDDDHRELGDARQPDGFNLFAGKCIPAFDKQKREHAIRYMARPPIPKDKLTYTSDGDVLLELKRPWSNGTTHARFTGTELLEKLASLVPPPRVNGVRYHGIFAPNAKHRGAMVEMVPLDETRDVEKPKARKDKTGVYHDWAELLQRVFEYDLTKCPRCGVRGMQQIAVITQPAVIRAILDSMGHSPS